jgi:hypothetical protein
MQLAITRPLTSGEGMQKEWIDGSPAREAVGQFIKPNDRLTSFDRLQIYNQQYWWRLMGNFGEDFSGVRAVIGQRKFDRLATAYLEQCGSRSWSLRDLGSELVPFLRAHPELTAPFSQLALEVAQVEWARVVAFDGPEQRPLAPAALARMPAGELRLRLQPYITLLELTYPVDDLLLKLKQSEVETGSVSNAVSAERPRRRVRLASAPAKEPIYLAVHRLEFSVYYKRLDREAFRLLVAVQAGEPLDTACEQAFAASTALPEELAATVQEWFAHWMRLGWLCRRASSRHQV